MTDHPADLDAAVSELDDGYLKVLLLLTVRRAMSEEPRRAGFWHGLAELLANEQEKRRGAAEFRHDVPTAIDEGDLVELETVIAELRRDLETIGAEYRESYGDSGTPGTGASP